MVSAWICSYLFIVKNHHFNMSFDGQGCLPWPDMCSESLAFGRTSLLSIQNRVSGYP